ncbi:MAG: ABC transporter permease [Spirochaetaceae bacterium]|jgi:peptide/nickel transport system permease protein|nr:ABC transporter permease [Spirochaetaceae bacterium]
MFALFVLRRILQLVPVFFGVTFLSFMLIRAAPGDAARFVLAERGIDLSGAALEKTRRELGLDAAAIVQYGAYIKAVLRGNLGRSYITKEPVTAELGRRFRVTALLSLVSMTLALAAAIAAGALCAVKQNTAFDRIVRVICLFGLSLPAFCLALLLIAAFALKTRLLPVFAGGGIARYILPCVTLTSGGAAYYTRFIRAALLEDFSKPYILAAKARGLSTAAIVRAAMKNASLPVLSSLSMSLAFLLGGNIVVEKIFAIPGVGSCLIDGITKRDYAAVDGCVLLYAAIFSLLNLISDIACARIHPLYEKT